MSLMEGLLAVSTILLWVLVLFNIVITIGLARRINRQMTKIETLKVGDQAPPFEASTLSGEIITSSYFMSQPTALIFISLSCASCQDEIARLRPLQFATQPYGVTLVIVSNRSEEETAALLSEFVTDFPILVAPRERSSFLDDYKVNIWPFYYLIDTNGEIQATGMTLRSLKQDIHTMYGEGGDAMQ